MAFAGFWPLPGGGHALLTVNLVYVRDHDEFRQLANEANERGEGPARAATRCASTSTSTTSAHLRALTAVRGADDERTWQLRALSGHTFDALRHRSPTRC
jgi:hypothetical protein